MAYNRTKPKARQKIRRPRLIVVSNRSPYHLESLDGEIRMIRNVSGMVTGLEPVLASTQGMWVAWGNAPAECDICRIPPDNPTFDLKLIPLDQEEIRHFYLGFSNSTLWPLAHNFLGRTIFQEADWEGYFKVNRKFAEAVAVEARPSDLIWVNDYHLALVPQMLRNLRVTSRIGFFWHIPFPPLDLFRTLPWRRDFLKGLLGSDLVGFHCNSYVKNLLHAVENLLARDVSFSKGLVRNKHSVRVSAFPMGIDYYRIQKLTQEEQTINAAKRIRSEIGSKRIILGVDRLDYSKGIPERLEAIEKLLEENPRFIGKLSFVQISVPSRIQLPEYRRMQHEVENAVGRINGKFSKAAWTPIRYYFRSFPFEELVTYYLAADVCLVTPLRDGMNLIAKEYAATQSPDKGMLVLSEFAGAAEEMKEAVIVNPHSIPSIKNGLLEAINMSKVERMIRMEAMRNRLKRRTVGKWGEAFLERLRGDLPNKKTVGTKRRR
ncbi:trehalose-6-phosphate synthase [candidate division WOR-3 bacterium]|nr:trehalose-6-phosphate synthase [candidate division WOR-3 bacterium]